MRRVRSANPLIYRNSLTKLLDNSLASKASPRIFRYGHAMEQVTIEGLMAADADRTFRDIARNFEALRSCGPVVAAAAVRLIRALRAGNKILFCGNGGSAADSQHLAAELTGRYRRDRRPLAAIAPPPSPVRPMVAMPIRRAVSSARTMFSLVPLADRVTRTSPARPIPANWRAKMSWKP